MAASALGALGYFARPSGYGLDFYRKLQQQGGQAGQHARQRDHRSRAGSVPGRHDDRQLRLRGAGQGLPGRGDLAGAGSGGDLRPDRAGPAAADSAPAKDFISFVVSQEGQQVLADAGSYPTRPGVERSDHPGRRAGGRIPDWAQIASTKDNAAEGLPDGLRRLSSMGWRSASPGRTLARPAVSACWSAVLVLVPLGRLVVGGLDRGAVRVLPELVTDSGTGPGGDQHRRPRGRRHPGRRPAGYGRRPGAGPGRRTRPRRLAGRRAAAGARAGLRAGLQLDPGLRGGRLHRRPARPALAGVSSAGRGVGGADRRRRAADLPGGRRRAGHPSRTRSGARGAGVRGATRRPCSGRSPCRCCGRRSRPPPCSASCSACRPSPSRRCWAPRPASAP